MEYDSFGNVIADSNAAFAVPFGFAGGLFDADTGLTRFGFRDYDADVGEWTAKDPTEFEGEDADLYGYVVGDPVNGVYSEGKFPLAGAVIGTIVGGMAVFFLGCSQESWPRALIGGAVGSAAGSALGALMQPGASSAIGGMIGGAVSGAFGGGVGGALTEYFGNPCALLVV